MLVLSEALKPWQNFYELLGTASATLVGLLFVAASVGSSVYSRDKDNALRVFLSPTVVHFSSVLAGCLITMAPVPNWASAGALVGGEGILGFAYALIVWRKFVQGDFMAKIDWEDRLWYTVVPALIYLAVAGAGVVLFTRQAWGVTALAVTLCMLLLAGMRNAWDMTLWTVMRAEN